MPRYEYTCPACKREFDKVLPVSEYQTPQACPDCGTTAQKRISIPGIVTGDNAKVTRGR